MARFGRALFKVFDSTMGKGKKKTNQNPIKSFKNSVKLDKTPVFMSKSNKILKKLGKTR